MGFDSLMFVELGGRVRQLFPAITGVPQSLLNASTTIYDLADYVRQELHKGAPRTAATCVTGT